MISEATSLTFRNASELGFAARMAARRVLAEFGFTLDIGVWLRLFERPEGFSMMVSFLAPNLSIYNLWVHVPSEWPDPCTFSRVVELELGDAMFTFIPPRSRLDRYLKGELEN